MIEQDWPSDDVPLFAEADRYFHSNEVLLNRLRAVSQSIELTIDGISIRTGYLFYLYMKLYRRTPSQGGGRKSSIAAAIGWQLGSLLSRRRLPRGESGDLRLDHPVDLYAGPDGVWNKNIGVEGYQVVLPIRAAQPFVPPETAEVGQSISLLPLFQLRTYCWGAALYKALLAGNLPISRRRFWQNHLLYLMRFSGFSGRFSRLFSDNRFNTVHFCRFADVDMQGMLHAARRHQIRAIEYQHGVLSSAHPAVALVDARGPATVPDILIVADPIYEGLDYGLTAVKTAAPHATFQVSQNTLLRTRGIAIAMQPRFAGDAATLALRLADDFPGVRFTLRSHPRAEIAEQQVAEINKRANLAYERAEEVESSVSLADSAGLITGSSTMGLSAAARGVPALFLHQEGFAQASQLLGVQQHLVSAARTYGEVKTWVRTVPAR